MTGGLGAPYYSGSISNGGNYSGGHGRVVIKYMWTQQL